ncbi:MAG: MotA/TolQ/ExbB proton channel family protein [Planctomycetota bacterium]|nr:MotA/TolQ/ExbB proton channel family protein [Planctomycetota bacterium]
MKFSPYHTIATIGSLFILAYVTEFRAHALFDVTGSLWVIGLTSLFLLSVYKKDFLSFIPYSLLCLFCAPTSPQPRHASIAKTAVRTTGAVGAIGLIVGMIFMLGALSDNPDGVGAGMAVALLTVLYGLVLGELFFGMVYYVSSQEPRTGDSEANLPVAGLLIGFLSSMAGIFMLFFVLYAISEV